MARGKDARGRKGELRKEEDKRDRKGQDEGFELNKEETTGELRKERR